MRSTVGTVLWSKAMRRGRISMLIAVAFQRFSPSVPLRRAKALQVIRSYVLSNIRPAVQIVKQYLRTGAAVASGMVVVKLQAKIVADRVQPMVWQLRQQSPSHLTGTGVISRRSPMAIMRLFR